MVMIMTSDDDDDNDNDDDDDVCKHTEDVQSSNWRSA